MNVILLSIFSCSSAFFAEERALLQKKREKVRLIQQQHKSAEIADLLREDRDLPDEIPMPLVIGMKVTGKNSSVNRKCLPGNFGC